MTVYSKLQLVDADTTADLLGCSPRTVRQLAYSGELRSVKVGRLLRFRCDDIAAFIDAHQTDQPQLTNVTG